MKKCFEEQIKASANMHTAESNSYAIGLERLDFVAESSKTPKEVMIRGAESIRGITGWEDPIDSMSIKDFLDKINFVQSQDIIVEEK